MAVVWGVVVTLLAVLAWGGQTLSFFAPATAERFGLADRESTVDPAFHADGRGEAMWDTVTLWPLVVAGVLLAVDAAAWPYFGLIGGAIYVYFAGRGVLARREMQKRGLAIGSEANVRTAKIILPVWGLAGAITMVASVLALVE